MSNLIATNILATLCTPWIFAFVFGIALGKHGESKLPALHNSEAVEAPYNLNCSVLNGFWQLSRSWQNHCGRKGCTLNSSSQSAQSNTIKQWWTQSAQSAQSNTNRHNEHCADCGQQCTLNADCVWLCWLCSPLLDCVWLCWLCTPCAQLPKSIKYRTV